MSSELTVADLTARAAAFAAERDWEQYHDPKNLVMALASEVGELSAHLRWLRNDEADSALRAGALRDRVIEEIGDVGILLLLLCNRAGVSLDDAVVQKLSLNAARYPIEASRGRAGRPASSE
jgi:dCTP diphosphatase